MFHFLDNGSFQGATKAFRIIKHAAGDLCPLRLPCMVK